MPKAHVFTVDKFSFPVHRSRGFCGVKNPPSPGFLYGLLADLLEIRIGDLVFFYQFRIDEPPEERGFRGIYRVISDPFFDDSDIDWNGYKVLGRCPYCGTNFSEKKGKCRKCNRALPLGHHILPYRVLIEPIEYFELPVDDNTAYIDHTDPGSLWTMLFRKVYGPGRERSISPILPEESRKLERLLRRVNDVPSTFASVPYPSTTRHPIIINLGPGPCAPNESVLRAWIMQNIDRGIPVLRDLVGPSSELEYFGNEVLFGIGGDKVDVLLLHQRDGQRFKATYIELKDEEIDVGAVKQADSYAKWVGQLSTANSEPFVQEIELQPALIGSDLIPDVHQVLSRFHTGEIQIKYPRGVCVVKVLDPVVLTYQIVARSMNFTWQYP